MSSKILVRPHPIFIGVFFAWISTLITGFIDPRIFSPSNHLRWEPGLAFALAVGIAMGKVWKVPVFVLVSVPIYFVVSGVYMDSVYSGPGALVVNTVFLIGALLELLAFTVLYRMLQWLRWPHLLLAVLAAVLSLLALRLEMHFAFAVWYSFMAYAFYLLIKSRDQANG